MKGKKNGRNEQDDWNEKEEILCDYSSHCSNESWMRRENGIEKDEWNVKREWKWMRVEHEALPRYACIVDQIH